MRGLRTEKRPSSPSSLYRSRLALLFNRVFTLTLSIGILGLTAYYASSLRSSGSPVSGQLGFVVASAVLTLPISAYLAVRNAPSTIVDIRSSSRPSSKGLGKFLQSSIDFFFTALWIAAAAVASGSATGFCTDGRSVVGLAAIMAFFFGWAGLVDLFTGAAV